MIPNVVCQSQDLQGNIVLVPGVGEGVDWGLCHRPKKMVTLQWLGWVLFSSLLVLD